MQIPRKDSTLTNQNLWEWDRGIHIFNKSSKWAAYTAARNHEIQPLKTHCILYVSGPNLLVLIFKSTGLSKGGREKPAILPARSHFPHDTQWTSSALSVTMWLGTSQQNVHIGDTCHPLQAHVHKNHSWVISPLFSLPAGPRQRQRPQILDAETERHKWMRPEIYDQKHLMWILSEQEIQFSLS